MGQKNGKDNKTIVLRFYAELNDFLKPVNRHIAIEFAFKGPMTIQEAIESSGVPHKAVDLVLVNSEPASFSQKINNGDYISVYPTFELLDITPISGRKNTPLSQTRFILDAHLGKLAKLLRLLGFDTEYYNNIDDNDLILLGNCENRIVLTRDRGILKSRLLTHGYYVRSIYPKNQLKEIIEKFDLFSQFSPFSRCLICNEKIKNISNSEIKNLVNPEILNTFKKIYHCPACNRIYWEGSHYLRMKQFIEELKPPKHSSVSRFKIEPLVLKTFPKFAHCK